MVKYIKWLLPVLFIAYYSSVSLFTHVHVEMDGAIHLLRLQFYSLKISNLSESPVYPDHVTSVEGLRYLRAPPVV